MITMTFCQMIMAMRVYAVRLLEEVRGSSIDNTFNIDLEPE